MDFKYLIDRTLKIRDRFTTKLGKQGRMLDLVEEVGELANAMLFVDGGKTSGKPEKQKNREDVADALADILYDLIILSEHYRLDLGEEYEKMLDEMEKRINSGEFD